MSLKQAIAVKIDRVEGKAGEGSYSVCAPYSVFFDSPNISTVEIFHSPQADGNTDRESRY